MGSVDSDLWRHAHRLSDAFTMNVKTDRLDNQKRGWGQFIGTNDHQIGLYGTCAGYLVRRIVDANDNVSEVEYNLISYWRDRANFADKYFVQTSRLAFFVLSLSQLGDGAAGDLRQALVEAVEELIRRQREDGAWGDGPTMSLPRLEATALSCLALANIDTDNARNSVRNGALYIQTRLVSNIPNFLTIDLFILSIPLRLLDREKIHRELIGVAAKRIRLEGINTETQTYYFFFQKTNVGALVERDYFCLPKFVGICSIITAPVLGKYFWTDLARTIIYNKIRHQLADILRSAPVATTPSEYKSTVDQAFLAISTEQIEQFTPSYVLLAHIVSPIINWIRRSALTRFWIPIIIVILAGTLGQDPANLYELPRIIGLDSDFLKYFSSTYKSAIQTISIGVGLLFGNPLITSVISYIKRKLSL